MKYSLRAANEEDKTWLDTLRKRVYQELFDLTWGGWDEERHQRHFAATWARGHIQIIEILENQVGMLQVLESDAEMKIGEIQIAPEFQRRGIGSKILKDLMEQAQNSAKNLTLSTGLKNAGAIKLYKRLGFVETKRTETHVYMMYAWSN